MLENRANAERAGWAQELVRCTDLDVQRTLFGKAGVEIARADEGCASGSMGETVTHKRTRTSTKATRNGDVGVQYRYISKVGRRSFERRMTERLDCSLAEQRPQADASCA